MVEGASPTIAEDPSVGYADSSPNGGATRYGINKLAPTVARPSSASCAWRA